MRFLPTLIGLLLVSPTIAEDTSQVETFNTAWEAYKEAVETGRSDLKIETSREVVELGRQVFPETDERLPLVMQRYGVALSDGKRKEESRKVLSEALGLMEAIHGDDSTELIPVLSDLADANGGFGDGARQLKHYKRAMKIAAKSYGKESLEYADVAFRAASNTYAYSRSRAGQKYLLEARDIFAAELGQNDIRTGMASFFLGKMQFSGRSNKKASDYLLEALPAFADDSDGARKFRLLARALLVQAYEGMGKSDLATEHCVAIGRERPMSPDQDYEPLFRIAPRYPAAMLRSGIQGYVDVEFTINEGGFVDDPRIIDAVTTGRGGYKRPSEFRKEDRSFDAAALAAVKRFRYAPRFEDGEAVSVDNVKTRISFELEQ